MSTNGDRRLIEDYLPIEAISKEASREKSVRKGHISTLHLWWARRPLVACRAAVYGALVPASRFRPKNGPEEKRDSLARANAARFVEALCKYPGDPQVIAEAQRHILEAHAERLRDVTGKQVTVEDIQEGRAPRPKVLDMFAGGGSIPLEALRLGCDACALDLNPVAHIIELCTLVYPQTYGKLDPTARGMTGPKNENGETTWGGLADEVHYWSNWVLKQVKAEIGDLYPLIPDPEFKGKKTAVQATWLKEHGTDDVPSGFLMPVAYLWTRTVVCKNPNCRAPVPLVRQTWLCKKKGRHVALKIVAHKSKKQVCFEVVEARSENALGFDPEAGSKGGNAICQFCGTVADSDYIKVEGCRGRIARQMMAIVCTRPGRQGKIYLSADNFSAFIPNDEAVNERIEDLCEQSGLTVPNEPIEKRMTGGSCLPYGLTDFGKLFTPRQILMLLTFSDSVNRLAHSSEIPSPKGHKEALLTLLALMTSRTANFSSTLCLWNYTGGRGVVHSFSRQSLPMTWDFPESNPLYPEAAGFIASIHTTIDVLAEIPAGPPAHVVRGIAQDPPFSDGMFDAVVTDPPYYDNVTYSNLSDFFYVWLKRILGSLHPEHFSAELAPKKKELITASYRHGDDRSAAHKFYEDGMIQTLLKSATLLKPSGSLVIVYAHKTTLGWATLTNSLRKSGFEVTEAWPLDTERPGGMKVDKAMLASSIFLVARKRYGAALGSYEEGVRPQLELIVRERVDTLWEMGISGADLVIACIGAGLRAFTRYAKVEYTNGEEVPAERFLTEVETVVLEAILGRLSKEVGRNGGRHGLASVDPATRFYTLWRYTYKAAELDAGEAIIFANGTHVELDGLQGLSCGTRPLIEKKKAKYRLLNFSERGDDAKLGLPLEDGQSAPLVDALHRLLWLMERHPSGIPEFLREARPNTEQMRLVAQALAGPALKGGEMSEVATGSELAALTKLTANWRSVVEDAAGPAEGPLFRAGRRSGQEKA
jgi:putative DNA methylase